jgi:hypothetical protein
MDAPFRGTTCGRSLPGYRSRCTAGKPTDLEQASNRHRTHHRPADGPTRKQKPEPRPRIKQQPRTTPRPSRLPAQGKDKLPTTVPRSCPGHRRHEPGQITVLIRTPTPDYSASRTEQSPKSCTPLGNESPGAHLRPIHPEAMTQPHRPGTKRLHTIELLAAAEHQGRAILLPIQRATGPQGVRQKSISLSISDHRPSFFLQKRPNRFSFFSRVRAKYTH